MYRPRSIGLLLAFVTLLVYLPATSCQFINYDDPLYITENPVVRGGLTWGGRQMGIHSVHVSNWHPLTWLSHMADCDLFRLNPAGPHLVNILFSRGQRRAAVLAGLPADGKTVARRVCRRAVRVAPAARRIPSRGFLSARTS